jgi:hypothetical protein
MRGIMPIIIDQAGRQFNADETDGVSRRHRGLAGWRQAGFVVERVTRETPDPRSGPSSPT